MFYCFVSSYLPDIYYKHTSLSLTCSKSDDSRGIPVTQCPSKLLSRSRHCAKRLLDGVDTSHGLALGKQREQKGTLVNVDCTLANID